MIGKALQPGGRYLSPALVLTTMENNAVPVQVPTASPRSPRYGRSLVWMSSTRSSVRGTCLRGRSIGPGVNSGGLCFSAAKKAPAAHVRRRRRPVRRLS